MSRHELTDRLKSEAIRLGFDAVGIAPAVALPGYPDFLRWLDSGHAAGMDYLRRNEAARAPEPPARRHSLGDRGQCCLRAGCG